MKTLRVMCMAVLVAMSAMSARADLITFTATGNPDVSGFVQFDNSFFPGGAFDAIQNSHITDLSITAFTFVFGLGDVVTTDVTFINSSGLDPIIVNGGGLLANNGSKAIAFFPEGFDGSGIDGDASLAFSETPTFGPFTFHQVAWVPSAAAVPEPSSILLLITGLLGLGGVKRKFFS